MGDFGRENVAIISSTQLRSTPTPTSTLSLSALLLLPLLAPLGRRVHLHHRLDCEPHVAKDLLDVGGVHLPANLLLRRGEDLVLAELRLGLREKKEGGEREEGILGRLT